MAWTKERSVLHRQIQMSTFKSPVDPELLQQFRKVLKFSFWFGGVPFTLNVRNRLRLVPCLVPYSVLCSSSLLLMTAFLGWSNEPIVHKTLFTKFLFLLRAIPFSSASLCWMYFVIANRSTIETVFQKLIKIERALFDINIKQKINYNLMYGTGMVIFSLIRIIGIPRAEMFTNPTKFILVFMYPYAYCCLFGAMEHFFFLVDSLWHYLDMVVRQVSSREIVLVRLCAIHDSLADARACIQRAYSFPLFCVLFSSFLCVNVNIFLWIKLVRLGATAYFVSGIFLSWLPILRIAYSCGRATRKGNEFYSVLHKIMKADNSCKLLYNRCLNAHLTKKKSFVFNAAGFYELNVRLIGSLIAATTTYSVLLVQMGKEF